jgi:hypothetical protein
MHHSVDGVLGGVGTMRAPPTDKPNLDDVLARDFAELKVGEDKIKSEPSAAPEVEKKPQPAVPSVYNQRIDAVEDRTSFAVRAPNIEPKGASATAPKKPQPTVLKAPSTQPGDDFDVEW